MLELYPHQQAIVDQNPHRHLLAHGTGTGKTITSITLANKNCETCLVVCPKINREMWKRETRKYKDGCKFTVVSKEEFRRDVHHIGKFDGVIIDEAHFFAGHTSKLHKAMHWYFKTYDTKYRWLCTATPYLSTPMNIYALRKLLGYPLNYLKFKKDFFYEIQIGHRLVPKAKSGMEEELAKLVKEVGSTVDIDSIVDDVPEQNFITEYIELTDEQKEGIADLDDTNFISRWTKTHAIENGILYSDGYTKDREFESNKTERILELVGQQKKTIIFCRYTAQIEYLERKIGLAHPGKRVYTLTGGTKRRDELILEAEKVDSCVLIIQAQISAGYELPSFPVVIFASLSFSYVDYKQACGRVLRINKLKENTFYHLVAKGVDKDVYDAIKRKEDFSLAIYDNQQ